MRLVSTKSREYTLKNGQRAHDLPNLGWDFTFSAPKSVSVLWSQGTPELRARIEKCHERAVEKATEHIEKCVYTRSGRGGKVSLKASPIFAVFTHTTSRSLDPQLHDHVILVNTAIGHNGKWGAIDARPFFREIHTLGSIYRAELRQNLEMDLGVRTVDRKVGKEKGFEVLGVPDALVREFSKRRASIEAEIAKLEKDTQRKASVKEIQAITKATREGKELPQREALFSGWREKGKALGFSIDAFLATIKVRSFTKGEEKAFLREVSHLLSYRDRITERDVFTVALSVSRGRIGTDEAREFTSNYISSYLTEVRASSDTLHYAFTREGLRKANERPRYTELRRSINRAVTRTPSVLYERKAKRWERKNRAFKVRITVAYALGRIDGKTYRKLTSNEIPRTKGRVQLLYATHQISKRQRDYFLRKLDPGIERKNALNAERRSEFVRRKKEKDDMAKELHRHGLISTETRDDITNGKISLYAVTRDLERRGGPREEKDDEKKRTHEGMPNPVYATMPFAQYTSTTDDGKKTSHYSLLNVYEVKEKGASQYALVYREYRYESSEREHGRPEVIEERHWGIFSKSEALRRAEEGRLTIENAIMRAVWEKGRDEVVEVTLGRLPRKVYESDPYNVRHDRADKNVTTYRKTSVERLGRSYSVIERTYEVRREKTSDRRELVSKARIVNENDRGVYKSLRSALGVAVSQVEKGSRGSPSPSLTNDRKEKENERSSSFLTR